MKKRVFLSSLLLVGMMLFGMRTASAIQLEFSADTFDTTGLVAGVDILSTTVSVTGLGAQVVSGYDFDVLYDGAELFVDSVVFNPLPLSLTGGIALDFIPGVLTVNDLSLAGDAFLDLVQGDTVDLFTINFGFINENVVTALSTNAGNSPPLCVVGLGGNCLQLGAAPEPASFALMGLGLAGLGFVRRRRQQ